MASGMDKTKMDSDAMSAATELRDVHSQSRKRGRKPIGDKPMTAAERQQRRRNRFKAALPKFGSADRLRLELYWWLKNQAYCYSKVTTTDVVKMLEQLATAIKVEAFLESKGEAMGDWINDYLRREGLFHPEIYAPKQKT